VVKLSSFRYSETENEENGLPSSLSPLLQKKKRDGGFFLFPPRGHGIIENISSLLLSNLARSARPNEGTRCLCFTLPFRVIIDVSFSALLKAAQFFSLSPNRAEALKVGRVSTSPLPFPRRERGAFPPPFPLLCLLIYSLFLFTSMKLGGTALFLSPLAHAHTCLVSGVSLKITTAGAAKQRPFFRKSR